MQLESFLKITKKSKLVSVFKSFGAFNQPLLQSNLLDGKGGEHHKVEFLNSRFKKRIFINLSGFEK